MAEFEENVSAQWEKSKSQMKEIEALAKGNASQTVSDAINGLKKKGQDIDKMVQDLKTSTETKTKATVEANMAKFNVLLGQVATKLKSDAAAKTAGQQK
jgi:predicted  nucleic acid-binding Zn-ribbon protein